LVRAVRRRLARAIYPGPLPTKPKASKAAPVGVAKPAVKPPAPRPSALTVDLDVALAWFEGRRPTYEKLAAAVAPHIDPARPMFDVGANIGYFTRVLAETTGQTGEVHLFEPIPNLATLCRKYLADVSFPVQIHEFGLSDEDATVDLYVANSGNLGWNTMVGEKTHQDMTRVSINVRSFESIGVDAVPSFIKIDVEGAEYRVFKGLLPALERWTSRPAILCEIGWGSNHPDWQKELVVFNALKDLGYRVLDLNQEPIDITTLSKTTDVLFVQ
jgi:FkbM family methyltransferase